MRKIKTLLLIVASVNLFGCATFYISKKQTVEINTNNAKSKVYVNNELIGEGQNIKEKLTKEGPKQVVVQTPGFKDANYVLKPQGKVGAYVPLVILDIPFVIFIYPILFDLMPQPKFFKYPKTNEFSSRHKYANKTASEKYIDLDAIKLTVIDKEKDLRDYYGVTDSEDLMAEIAKVEAKQQSSEERLAAKNAGKKKKVKLNEDDERGLAYDDTKFSETLFKTLKKTGYIDTTKKIFMDNNNVVSLEGNIKKVSVFHVDTKTYATPYQKAKIYMTWNIKNSFGERIDSISGWTYSDNFVLNSKTKSEKMFADAVETSYLNLLKNNNYTKYLSVDSNYSITDAVLNITKPANVVTEVSDGSAATVTIKRANNKGHGTGFAISNDGYILTNFHVIAGDEAGKQADITVLLSNGDEIPVKIVRFNRMRDIALLKVDKTFEKAFNLSAVKSYKNLQEVYTIGTPKSLELGQSVSLGLISNERKFNNYNSLLQLSMSVNSGNSGGPLFEKSGTLHGVVTSKLVGFSTEGVGFAIPSYLIPGYLNLSVK